MFQTKKMSNFMGGRERGVFYDLPVIYPASEKKHNPIVGAVFVAVVCTI